MTHPIIKTDNYILITSDEDINIGDYWHYLGEKDDPVKNVLVRSWFEKLHDAKMYKKVIAHLPLNNEPILEGVPLLPPLPDEEDDVEKLVNNYVQELVECKSVKESGITWISAICHQSMIKAKEKYKFTEEDVRFIILKSFLLGVDMGQYSKELEDRLVSSLSQPKLPVGFKCQMNKTKDSVFYNNDVPYSSQIIINGVVQGEWIFE